MNAISGVLSVAIVLAAARLGGFIAERLKQPSVLGELAAGLMLGNLALAGYTGLEHLRHSAAVDYSSRVAVIVLLFQASIESTVGDMKRIGVTACLVALCGFAGSFAAVWGVAQWLLPSATPFARLFLAASLTATSVGVSARVLNDLGQRRRRSAQVILGAAVVDDVAGLLVLAVMTASGSVALILGKASVFLVGGLAAAMFVSPRLLSLASRSMSIVLLTAAFGFCFAMAWLASLFGLAPIVGAFAAGLAIEEWHYQDFIDRRERTLNDLVAPLASWLVPIFFVVIGLRTDLSGLARPAVLVLAGALTVAALAGKLCCGLGVRGAQRDVDRIAVGVGMMPRGEVTLIFAALGLPLVVAGRPVMTPDAFLAVVITVVATTMITPGALKWRLARPQ